MRSMKTKSLYLILLLFISGTFVACKKEFTPEEQLNKDIELIRDYLNNAGLSATQDESGLFYIIKVLGDSITKPSLTSTVTVDYRGYLLDGTRFDSVQSFRSKLNRLIEGWQIGIPLIYKGGEIDLYIPSTLAYGKYQVGEIPPNSPLIFEIKLLKVE